jgi:hypothetical protein
MEIGIKEKWCSINHILTTKIINLSQLVHLRKSSEEVMFFFEHVIKNR